MWIFTAIHSDFTQRLRNETHDLDVVLTKQYQNQMDSPSETDAFSDTPEHWPLNPELHYVDHLVPDLTSVVNCPYYWGRISKDEAEVILEVKPAGSFLLRDSGHERHAFAISFRRNDLTCHMRIESTRGHRFNLGHGDLSFATIPLLLDFVRQEGRVMKSPVLRTRPLALVELARAALCDRVTYEGVGELNIPQRLKGFLRELSYQHILGQDSGQRSSAPKIFSL